MFAVWNFSKNTKATSARLTEAKAKGSTCRAGKEGKRGKDRALAAPKKISPSGPRLQTKMVLFTTGMRYWESRWEAPDGYDAYKQLPESTAGGAA